MPWFRLLVAYAVCNVLYLVAFAMLAGPSGPFYIHGDNWAISAILIPAVVLASFAWRPPKSWAFRVCGVVAVVVIAAFNVFWFRVIAVLFA
jgi:hypothetical protein